MQDFSHVVVVGASAGGVESLREVVAGIPGDFQAPICVVLHIPPFVESSLPHILDRAGPLSAVSAMNGATIKPGSIYVAPADHHLLVDPKGKLAVTKGPKENRFRPSIDALFRSAAYTFGSRTIGVVLSGQLDDGTSGLWSVQRLGGITVVQEPHDARFESMPRSALEFVDVDYNVPASDIPALLVRLVGAEVRPPAPLDEELDGRMMKEIAIASENGAFQKGVMELGTLTPFTCPECHGVLVRIHESEMARFRCHTGHAYTDSSLLEGVMESTGEMLWQVMRSLEEAVMVLQDMARNLEDEGQSDRARTFRAKAVELEKRSATFHEEVLEHESLSGDNLGQDD
jgi:two-component system, chemotaxis family, protein-glutamate methylesterase/glutaminase